MGHDVTALPIQATSNAPSRENCNIAFSTTYRESFPTKEQLQEFDGILISGVDAIYYMVSSVLEREMKQVVCTHCGHPHLDRDWFSVHAINQESIHNHGAFASVQWERKAPQEKHEGAWVATHA